LNFTTPDRIAWRLSPAWGGRQDDASLTLVWAVAASVLIHGALLLATRSGGPIHGTLSVAPRVIEAVLAPVQVAPEPAEPIHSERSEIAVKQVPAPAVATPRPASAPKVAAQPPAPKAATHGVASLLVTGVPIADKSQLGDYANRQLSEFRAEIDRPVRLEEPIVARYPPAALREGREDSVSVWIVVDHTGQADEVDVIEGSPEFAEEVVAAVKGATFLPAEQRLRPIRYPLALEFRFRLGDAPAARSADGAR
jgi:TonB family protein